MLTLYYYEHCPYCVRVLAFLGMAKIDFKPVVLANDDEETPVQMIGQKMLPILEIEPGKYLPESLDIIDFLAERSHFTLYRNQSLETQVEKFLTGIRKPNYGLSMPRWVKAPLKEFASASARDYFIAKKNRSIGDFEQALANTDTFKKALTEELQHHAKLFKQLTQQPKSLAAIVLFSGLYGITYVENFDWPTAAKDFMQTVAETSGLALNR